MNKIVKTVVAGVAWVVCVFATQAKTTYRDSLERKQGSSETDRYGKTTYRDAQGRIQGSKK